MDPLTRLALVPLLDATDDSEKIVRIAATRAYRELVGDQASEDLLEAAAEARRLIEDPAVTGDLWIPPQKTALRLASGAPKRTRLLGRRNPFPDDPVLSQFWLVASPQSDPGANDPTERLALTKRAVQSIAELGSGWMPDVTALFGIYLALFDQATRERLDWIAMQPGRRPRASSIRMPDTLPSDFGALIASTSLAWAASRGPSMALLDAIGPALKARSPKVRWAAAQFLEESARWAAYKEPPTFGGGTLPRPLRRYGYTLNAPPIIQQFPDLSPSLPSTEVPPIEAPRDPDPRYADVKFLRDSEGNAGGTVPDSSALKAGRWYWLEAAIRREPSGLKPEEAARPIRAVKQAAPIELLVTAESEDFEFDKQVDTITLPPTGDSLRNAFFRIRPRKLADLTSNPAPIDLRFFYRFNLLEHLTVTAKIGNKEETSPSAVLKFRQESIKRDYLDFDEFRPRRMNVHVSRKDEMFHLEFTLRGEGGNPVVMRARSTLTGQDLEDKLVRLRELLESLVLNDYLEKIEGTPYQFLQSITRLAEFGRDLWMGLFRKNPNSDLDKIGIALKDRPLESDALIQISMPDSGMPFLFPWAALYDRSLPQEINELPDPQGFWGYRYAIEQDLPGRYRISDLPRQVEGSLRMAFMLWEDFPNSEAQKKFMAELRAHASGLAVSDPPVIRPDEFYNLANTPDDLLFYFYTHGHTRKPSTAAKKPDLAGLVKIQMDALPEDTPTRKSLAILLRRLRENESEPDKSYIQLSKGRLYYNEILNSLSSLPSEPFIFLNMCESAEIAPLTGENFISLFLGLGARAILGTECTMTVEFAHPFSQVFLSEILRGEPLANALRTARRHFLDNRNPLGLAYTLFGSGALRFVPPRLQGDTTLDEKTR